MRVLLKTKRADRVEGRSVMLVLCMEGREYVPGVRGVRGGGEEGSVGGFGIGKLYLGDWILLLKGFNSAAFMGQMACLGGDDAYVHLQGLRFIYIRAILRWDVAFPTGRCPRYRPVCTAEDMSDGQQQSISLIEIPTIYLTLQWEKLPPIATTL